MSLPRLFLCTTGTSVAQGLVSLQAAFKTKPDWDHPPSNLRAELRRKIESIDLLDEIKLRAASAETNILSRFNPVAGDKCQLLVTDTGEGNLCAEALVALVSRAWDIEVDTIRIPGLQTSDADRLRREGLPAFMRKLGELIVAHKKTHEIILSPNGGYKGIVPFLALAGFLHGVRVAYVFEHAEEVIDLPSVPMTFDLALAHRVAPALARIRAHGPISETEFFREIAGFSERERSVFLPFIEVNDDSLLEVSPLISVFEAAFSAPEGLRINPDLLPKLAKLNGHAAVRLRHFLQNLRNPIWRSTHLHTFNGTDLEVFKPGNVPERAAGITTPSGEFYLCEYYSHHDVYEADLIGRKCADYAFATWPALDNHSLPELAESAEYDELGLVPPKHEIPSRTAHTADTKVGTSGFRRKASQKARRGFPTSEMPAATPEIPAAPTTAHVTLTEPPAPEPASHAVAMQPLPTEPPTEPREAPAAEPTAPPPTTIPTAEQAPSSDSPRATEPTPQPVIEVAPPPSAPSPVPTPVPSSPQKPRPFWRRWLGL